MEGMAIDKGLYDPVKSYDFSGRMSSSSVNSRLIEIVPIQHESKWTIRYLNYTRILVDKITRASLMRRFEDGNFRSIPQILEFPTYFIYQYEDRCPIFISRMTGRLYVLENSGFDKDAMEHQAATLLSILHKNGLVDGLSYKRVRVNNGGKNTNSEKQSNQEVYKNQVQSNR